MKNTHQHWRALSLDIPVTGMTDAWVAGRNWAAISADIARLLPSDCRVQGEILGQTTDQSGSPIRLSGHFTYQDLGVAVCAFKEIWTLAEFPDRTRLTHVERFPDCSFKHHVLIRWIGGKMDPYSTKLTDDVLLGPHNA